MSKAIRLAKTGSLTERQPLELRWVWEEHDKTDTYPTLSEVQGACDTELPGRRWGTPVVRQN